MPDLRRLLEDAAPDVVVGPDLSEVARRVRARRLRRRAGALAAVVAVAGGASAAGLLAAGDDQAAPTRVATDPGDDDPTGDGDEPSDPGPDAVAVATGLDGCPEIELRFEGVPAGWATTIALLEDTGDVHAGLAGPERGRHLVVHVGQSPLAGPPYPEDADLATVAGAPALLYPVHEGVAVAVLRPGAGPSAASQVRCNVHLIGYGVDEATLLLLAGALEVVAESEDADLPGERVETYPYADAGLAVVGVAADDVLNIRARPGADYGVVGRLAPLADDLVATGHNRRLDDGSTWAQVVVDGTLGWANTRFLLQPGQVDDVTAALWPDPSDRARAGSLDGLARAVAALRASTDPPSRVVVVDGPIEEDLGVVAVDVLGLGDDSVGGERLLVFADRVEGGGWQVRSVEATTLCSRGIAAGGVCI